MKDPNSGSVLLQVRVAGGTLVVRPLTVEWLGRAADLLTDVFATMGGPGYQAYRRYMNKQIRTFLEVMPCRKQHTGQHSQNCIPYCPGRWFVAVPLFKKFTG